MDYKENEKGKCETCGFFSKHGLGNNAPSPRFYEVEIGERANTNNIFSHYWENRHVTCEIACFEHKIDFMREIKRPVDLGEQNRKLVEMVRQDRHCETWYPYRPGYSPKEHHEELQMQRLEQDRRAFEDSLSRRAEDLHTSLALRDEQLQAQRDHAATSTNKLMTRLTTLALILAAAQVLTLTRDSLIAKAAIWLWLHLRNLFS